MRTRYTAQVLQQVAAEQAALGSPTSSPISPGGLAAGLTGFAAALRGGVPGLGPLADEHGWLGGSPEDLQRQADLAAQLLISLPGGQGPGGGSWVQGAVGVGQEGAGASSVAPASQSGAAAFNAWLPMLQVPGMQSDLSQALSDLASAELQLQLDERQAAVDEMLAQEQQLEQALQTELDNSQWGASLGQPQPWTNGRRKLTQNVTPGATTINSLNGITQRNVAINCTALAPLGLEACAEPLCSDIFTLVQLADGGLECRQTGRQPTTAPPALQRGGRPGALRCVNWVRCGWPKPAAPAVVNALDHMHAAVVRVTTTR
ncbi:hypothetical protein V8C86DRAFT_3023331 [Haematococcus lacustris]